MDGALGTISLDHNLYQMTPKVTTLTLFKNGLETLPLGKITFAEHCGQQIVLMQTSFFVFSVLHLLDTTLTPFGITCKTQT